MPLTKQELKTPFWALPIIDALEILETTKDGLSNDEISRRQKVFGLNTIATRLIRGPGWILLRQFFGPLNIILLVAGILALILQDKPEAIFIALAFLLSIGLGFYQENKSESIVAKLRFFLEEKAKVIRNAGEIELGSEMLVPGDIIHIVAGDLIPADARLVYVNDLQIDESILTGESLPVTKNIRPIAFNTVIQERHSMVHRGTLATQGVGLGVITATGVHTEFGRIVGEVMKTEREVTPLQRSLNTFTIKLALGISVLIAVFIVGGGLLHGYTISETLLLALAVLVASVPEGLPVALTFCLALGIQRLSQKKGLIRKLLAIEILGGTSLILTDKTGTLTTAAISLSEVISLDPSYSDDEVLKIALLNSDVVIENPKAPYREWRLIGRLLEKSLVTNAAERGVLLPAIQKKFNVVQHLPFNSRNKFAASLIQTVDEGRAFIAVLGAPEYLLRFGGSKNNEAIHHRVHALAAEGKKVLGLAVKKVKEGTDINFYHKNTYADFKFIGLIAMKDSLRPEVPAAIALARTAGIRTVIVTGDHEGTAKAIGRELGFGVEEKNLLSGQLVDELSEEALCTLLPNINIVYRVSPEGKDRLVRLYKKMGEVVAMTGDGINDAPALKAADVGVAMGSGSDIAKEVSDLILLDDNYATIITAIEEGRRVAANIKRIIVYLFISIFNELFLISGAFFFGLPVPLTASQILFINLLLDSLPALSLAFEDGKSYLGESARIKATFFDTETKIYTFGVGVFTSLALLGVYSYGVLHGAPLDQIRTLVFLLLGSYTLFSIFSIRDLQEPLTSYNPFSNRFLLGTVILSFILLAGSVVMPFAQMIFHTISLPISYIFGVIGFGIFNIIFIESIKFFVRRSRI